jgi:hypothetical protein
MTRSGARGVVNDSIAVYLADATIASAFVARWCVVGRWTRFFGSLNAAS